MVTKTDLKQEFKFKEGEDGFLFKRVGNTIINVKSNRLIVKGKVIIDLDFVSKKELRSIMNRVINAYNA